VKRRLGNLERQLFAYAQMRRLRELRTGDLAGPLGITPKQERELLSRLSRSGLIAKVRRGLYLVPSQLPLGATWTPDEAFALNAAMADRRGRYQICGPNAFNRYGFSNQVPQRIYAYNNRVSEERTVGVIALHLIKVASKRLGDTERERTTDGDTLVYSSRVRTLLDAVYDWSRFGSLPRGYVWIRDDLRARRVTAADLVRVTLRYGNISTIRRMGALLEREGVSDHLLRKLRRAFDQPTRVIPWIPTEPQAGKVNPRWGVLLNGAA